MVQPVVNKKSLSKQEQQTKTTKHQNNKQNTTNSKNSLNLQVLLVELLWNRLFLVGLGGLLSALLVGLGLAAGLDLAAAAAIWGNLLGGEGFDQLQ